MKVYWFNKSADTTVVRNAEACDMAFFISRHFEEGIRTEWTNFNKVKGMVDPPLTTVGYVCQQFKLQLMNLTLCTQLLNDAGT